ncbi:hypothetical protein JYU04_00900 [Dehalococcoides mccartyi]|nr:hypothetical protein [Dehalococcoides mccartyi]
MAVGTGVGGPTVGVIVGTAVDVGDNVGTTVGAKMAVGIAVGAVVAVAVGWLDGAEVEIIATVAVGALVAVGTAVGVSDRFTGVGAVVDVATGSVTISFVGLASVSPLPQAIAAEINKIRPTNVKIRYFFNKRLISRIYSRHNSLII